MALMTQDVDVFFDTGEHGQTVTYETDEITAIVDYGENLSNVDRTSWDSVREEAIMWVKASDIASPAKYDAVTIDSVSWEVDRVLTGDGGVWELALIKSERPVL